MLARIRRAARRLTPVVLDLGPGQPRFESFLTHIEGKGRDAWLHMSPICVDALPPSPSSVVVRSAAPEDAFALSATILEPVLGGGARVPLEGAHLDDLPARRGPRARPADDPLMLVMSGGAEDVEAQAFPIVDVGPDVCSIDAAVPLAVGLGIDPIEIVGEGRTLRRAAAIVEEVIPWCTPHGGRRFRCRLALGKSSADPSGRIHDLISDPVRVRRLLELASMSACEVQWRLAGGAAGTCQIGSVAQAEMSLESGGWSEGDASNRAAITLAFELFGVSYEMDVRYVRREGTRLEVALPLFVRRRRRRQEPRVVVPHDKTLIACFTNPASGERVERQVHDFSFRGLCFHAEVDQDVLWSGMPLGAAELHFAGKRARLGELVVRHVDRQAGGTVLCHVSTTAADLATDPDLIDIVASLKHPDLVRHDGTGFPEIVATYRQAGLLYDYMREELVLAGPAVAPNWRKLHSPDSIVARTLVRLEHGRPVATMSAVRAWERSWFVQHFGVTSSSGALRWAGELQMAMTDHLMMRPDGRFVIFVVNEANVSMNAFYARFFELTGTPEAIERGRLELWSRPAHVQRAPAHGLAARGWHLRPARASEEQVVARAAERVLGPRTAAALSLRPGELRIPDTARRFRRLGLERERRCLMLCRGREPACALLRESTSPGVNLTWMLSASWLLPIRPGIAPVSDSLRALLGILDPSPDAPLHDRFLLIPRAVPAQPLEEQGWLTRMIPRTYVLNRSGLHRYYLYIADRYGQVTARTMARQAQRRRKLA